MHRTVCAIQCPAMTRTVVRRFGHIPSSRCQANRCLEQRNRVSSTLDVVSRSTFDGAGSGGARRDRTDDLLLAKQALSQLSYGPGPERTHPRPEFRTRESLVGLGRLELPTSRLSSARSNQLSYKPEHGPTDRPTSTTGAIC